MKRFLQGPVMMVPGILVVLFLFYSVNYRSAKRDDGRSMILDKKYGGAFEKTKVFRAAADKEIITPDHQIPMGGFSPKRLSLGVHDDLYARCLVIECPTGEKLAFVTLDLVGFLRYDVLKIREEFREQGTMDPDCLFIASTHTHSGPDTVGIWSRSAFPFAPNLAGSGRDESYLKNVREKIVALVERTITKLEPAEFSVIEASGEGYSKNIHLPKKDRLSPTSGQLDVSLTTLVARRPDGSAIATLTNFGCHPETFERENQLLSADYPGALVKDMEREFGGTALFANGLLGAMVSCRTDLVRDNHKTAPERANAMGNGLTKRITDAAPGSKPIDFSHGYLRIRKKLVTIPLDNFIFEEGMKLGIIPHNDQVLTENREVLTEIGIIDLGDLRILMIPGEIQPGLGLKIKQLTGARMAFGLANDEIGYIIPTEDFHKTTIDEDGKTVEVYAYEQTVSLGQQTGNRIYDAFRELNKR